MSYEICAFDAAFASGKDAALDAWDQGTYFDTSRLDYDRSARKWRIKEALMAFNPELTCKEPKEPAKGYLAKAFVKPPPERRCLIVYLHTGGEDTSLDIFDEAVEINLPFDAEAEQVNDIVRDMWRHLEKLSQLGFSTIYDAERDVLLNLETDFDVVVQDYRKNLEDGEETSVAKDAAVSNERAPQAASSAARPASSLELRDANRPFAGNVGESKPWWKIW